ncbi:MAG: type II/IV secretion system protein [Candidatus Colwellbacteria bacterium]|nr:type II/IV secretion system protein [Candidatus Colwellbacteria bacterium]
MLVASLTSLKKAWGSYPPARETKEITGRVEVSNEVLQNFKKEIKSLGSFKDLMEKLFESKASEIIEAVLAGAVVFNASDVHFEPEKEKVRLRLRIDGVLEDVDFLPVSIYQGILNRIKLLSGLKLNIHEKAQDGRFSITSGKDEVEIRTSVLPGAWGENIVIRVLNPEITKLNLENLGIREDDLAVIERELQSPTGMILTTGPTGSGKTTTLYAFIKKVLTPDIKIITIEDPIEYHIEGISQTQVEPDKGYDFSSGLRSIVRQDPDVVLVGEIRDFETAEIAMQAALTGHLVLSTLHTNDAAGAVPRLIDLGVKPEIIAPAVNLLIAQRLVRKLCQKCAEPRIIKKDELQTFKKILGRLPSRVKLPRELNDKTRIFESRGCEKCHSGYSGRLAVMELFQVDDEMERLILTSPGEAILKEALKNKGFVSMLEDAVIKIIAGLTDEKEIKRVLGDYAR